MQKYLTINKKTKKVVAHSDGLNNISDKFEQKKITITKEDLDKLNGQNGTFYKNGKFIFQPFESSQKEALDEIKNKVSSATDIDSIKIEIIKLIDIIK